MAGLVPAIHVLDAAAKRRGCPRICEARGHDAVLFVGRELPVDAVPVQCADDARPDPVAHAVLARAPRIIAVLWADALPGPALSGRSAYRCCMPAALPLLAALPAAALLVSDRAVSDLVVSALSPRLGLDGRRPLDIFRGFGSLRDFGGSRSVGSLGRRRLSLRGLAAAERQAPIASLSGSGC